ncbi:MAG: transporter substrate-binding domain-containing protein [Chlamydiae bacterium]|nr:transporter substrate-binding domain-containing protein [Chlamydiota bacterium]
MSLLKHFVGISAVFALILGVSKPFLHLRDSFHRQFMAHRIIDVIPDPAPAVIYKTEPPTHPVPSEDFGHIFQRILETRIIRVGYSILDIPYCYLNDYKELVGYDIAYAYQLAHDLDCSLEFIPIGNYENIASQIQNEEYDIAMTAVIMDVARIAMMSFTVPYDEEDYVLVVPRDNISQFVDLVKVMGTPHLKIGAYGEFAVVAKRHFPLADIRSLHTSNPERFLSLFEERTVDATLWSRPQAFVWCLSHPDFVTIDYQEALGKCYFSYPVKIGATPWVTFLNHWLALKIQDGFHQRMIDFWLEGKGVGMLPPRWSVLRNVLHWVD